MMKQDILINLAKNGIVYKDTSVLGIENENIVTNMVFKFQDGFVDGTAILEVDFDYIHHYEYVCNGEETGTYEIDGNTFTMPTVVSGDYLYYYKDLKQLTHKHENTTTLIQLTTGTSENKLNFIGKSKGYYQMTKGTDNYSIPIKNTLLLKKGKIYFNLRITEPVTINATPIYKSNKFYLEVKDTINATNTIPEEYPSIIDILNNKLEASNILAGQYVTIDRYGNNLVINSQGGGGGTGNYNDLINKPKINNVELIGNKSLHDLGINIPTKTSDLQNNSGFINKLVNDLENYTKSSELGDLALKDKVNYNTDIDNTPDLTTKVNISDIINDTLHNNTNKPLSANMGKELQEEIDNLKARGRYLSLWNAITGLAQSDPTTSPYTYKAGDYFIVGTVGTTNYKPTGTQYVIGTASTTVETSSLSVDDVYYFDGSTWRLQINTQKTVSFANIAGQPSDNSNLASALNSKENVFRYANMPTADSTNVNKIVEYVGATGVYTQGYFYKNVFTQIQESITATQTDNIVSLGTITLDDNTLKSQLNAGTHEFVYRPYDTVLNFSNISVFPPVSYQVTRDSAFDRQPMIPNAPKLYSWVDNSNNFYATDTLQPNALTKLYTLDIQTYDVTDTGATFISSNTPSQIEGRWTKKEGDIYTDVEISDYGILLSSAGLPGNTIKVTYIEASNSYNWEQINVQPTPNSTWGNIGGTLSNQTDLVNALNNKEDKILNISSISGTSITLEEDKIYTLSISANTIFTLPTITDGKFHQIMIFASITGTPTITWGTSYFFNGEAPTIDADTYNFLFEYDGTTWYVGALKKGSVS